MKMSEKIEDIYYSCLLCKKEFYKRDEIEYHLGEIHQIIEKEGLDKSYLIHIPLDDKGVSI